MTMTDPKFHLRDALVFDGIEHVLMVPRDHLDEILQGQRDLFNFGWPQPWARAGMRIGLCCGDPRFARPWDRGRVVATVTIETVVAPADPADRLGVRSHPQYVGDHALVFSDLEPLDG
jgi:hypothetical protein